MFNKEESKKNKKCKVENKISFKRIGTFILTATLINSLSSVKAENIDYHEALYNYGKRVEEYMETREYDMDFFKLYHTGRFIINNNEIKKDRVFIVAGYVNNELELSLYTASTGKVDLLTGKEINYENPKLIPLIQTSFFEKLLNKKLIIVEDRYMHFDMERKNEIIDELYNWDGLAHSLTPETDAFENKVLLERNSYEEKRYN